MRENKQTVLPNFLIAGAAKCGISTLYYALKQHPDVFMSTPKEPDFFFAQFSGIPTNGIGDECHPVVRTYEEYCSLFEPAAGKKAIGDASHTNLYHYQRTIPLIKQHLGDPRIIIILRNPVDRAFAGYSELALEGREPLSFADALREEPRRIAAGWRPTWYYRDLGLYAQQVKAFLENFSAVKVCLFDDLRQDPVALLRELFQFLGVDEAFQPNLSTDFNYSGVPRSSLTQRLFSRKPPLQRIVGTLGRMAFTEDGWARVRERVKSKLLAKSVLDPGTRRALEDFYREDIARLQLLIKRDLSHWLGEPAQKRVVQ